MGILAHVVVAVKTDLRSRRLAIGIGLVRRTVVVDMLHILLEGDNQPRLRMVALVVVG